MNGWWAFAAGGGSGQRDHARRVQSGGRGPGTGSQLTVCLLQQAQGLQRLCLSARFWAVTVAVTAVVTPAVTLVATAVVTSAWRTAAGGGRSVGFVHVQRQH
jgi:hypothetical protein